VGGCGDGEEEGEEEEEDVRRKGHVAGVEKPNHGKQ
jgi:hypothetical protein